MKQLIVILVLTNCVFSNHAFSHDDEKPNNKWLVEFISEGLDEATAFWKIHKMNNWNKKEVVDIHFDFKTNIYQFNFDLKYTENWDILTHDRTENPPKIKKRFTSSEVTFWSNFKGIGSYKEKYSRRVPNWMNFKNLDTLLILFSAHNTEAAINNLFLAEEEKIIKKLYKSRKKSNSKIWKQFEFDSKGDLIGISNKYLETISISTVPRSGVEEYRIRIRNNAGDFIEVELLRSNKEYAIVEGVKIKNDKGELVIFNSAFNYKLHKFAPQIFRDPSYVLLDFLESVQEESGQKLERVPNIAVANE